MFKAYESFDYIHYNAVLVAMTKLFFCRENEVTDFS